MLLELICYMAFMFILGCVATETEKRGHLVLTILCMIAICAFGALAIYTGILYGIEFKGGL